MNRSIYRRRKLWQELIIYFPFIAYWVYERTRTAQETPHSTVFLLESKEFWRWFITELLESWPVSIIRKSKNNFVEIRTMDEVQNASTSELFDWWLRVRCREIFPSNDHLFWARYSCFLNLLLPKRRPYSKHIVTYTGYVCAVVWLLTIRGFGLDTGFIHYGDLQLHTLLLQWEQLHTDRFWLQRITDFFRCRRVTHFFRCQRLTNFFRCRRLLPSLYNIWLPQ
jgi:hypothetical protein